VQLASCEPIYVEMKGWSRSTNSARKLSELPVAARNYVKQISRLTGARSKIVSVGPKRAQTILT
jgi:adenylosuccinate synthase